jgi:hypothetical protein
MDGYGFPSPERDRFLPSVQDRKLLVMTSRLDLLVYSETRACTRSPGGHGYPGAAEWHGEISGAASAFCRSNSSARGS